MSGDPPAAEEPTGAEEPPARPKEPATTEEPTTAEGPTREAGRPGSEEPASATKPAGGVAEPAGAEVLADAWDARFGAEVSTEETFGGLAVGVPPDLWVEALTFARDDLACGFFDWLTGVDELDEGFAVVAHLYSLGRRHHLLVRTRVPKRAPVLATATGVYRGAAWHERETAEMFGILFEGHPNLVPLLLPDGFEGHPLRKDFVLASRVAKPWPGAKEPGESGHGAPSRRRVRPPGVPDEGPWAAAAERRRSEERPDAGDRPREGRGPDA